MNLTFIITILLFFIALGKAFDYLSYNREKSKLFTFLKRKGIQIQNSNSREFKNILLKSIVYFFNSLISLKPKRIKRGVRFMALSWIITTSFFLYAHINPACNCNGLNLSTLENWHDILPLWDAYVINFVFDYLTIFVTLHLFRLALTKTAFAIPGFVLLDIGISLFLAWACYLSLDAANRYKVNHYFPGIELTPSNNSDPTKVKGKYTIYNYTIEERETIIDEILYLGLEAKVDTSKITNNTLVTFQDEYAPLSLQNYIIGVTSFVIHKQIPTLGKGQIILEDEKGIKSYEYNYGYPSAEVQLVISISTLFPILIYSILVLFFLFSKTIFIVGSKFTERIINTSIEGVQEDEIDKFKPGLHFGIVLGLILALLNIVSEALNLL